MWIWKPGLAANLFIISRLVKILILITNINNNDENRDENTIASVDSSNRNHKADNPVILHRNTHFFLTLNQAFTY